MKTLGFCVIVVVLLATWSESFAVSPDQEDSWSKSVDRLQIRITLREGKKINGTRQLVPYLELRNSGDSAYPFKVRCDGEHIKFELVGQDGKVIRDGYSLPRSGPHPDPGTVILPFDSSMSVWMGCTNWGIPKDAPAMISTDSGAWVLRPEEKGKAHLRVTIQGTEDEADPDRTWHGKVESTVLVDWKE